MKTIDDALKHADTFDSPHTQHMSIVMLAAEVRRLRDEVNGLTGSLHRAESALQNLMSYLSVNGCRTEIDPENAEIRIRDGINMLVRPVLERAELAEAELAKLREQKPALYMAFSECGQFIRYWTRDTANLDATMAVNDFTVLEFFARPVPAAPAVAVPAVPEEWREVLRECADDLAIELDQRYGDSRKYPSEQRKYEAEMQPVYRARSLLQSADHSELAIEKVAPDCRACANRGRINGLSQEFYCDSCIYQGRDWRQNHFVDVSKMVDEVNRRCEACAILPCSCK